MTTTVDIQLFLNAENTVLINNLKRTLSPEFIVEEETRDGVVWIISYRSESELIQPLDKEIGNFLNKLLPSEEILQKLDKMLRVGVFYDIQETIVCPIVLGENTIALLARFHVKLFLTGYLCSDPES